MTHRLCIFREWIEFDADESCSVEDLEKKISDAYKNQTGASIESKMIDGELCLIRKDKGVSAKITWGEVE